MSDIHLPTPSDHGERDPQPEVRLELTRAGVQQVLSLYSQEQESSRSQHAFAFRLEDLHQVIRERRRIVAAGMATGVALACLVLFVAEPLYPVSAQVVLERHEVSPDATGGGPGAGSSSFIATQAEVMQSHSVVAAAVASLPRPADLDADEDATLDALESISATPVSGTQVVALGYLGPDADYGVKLLAAIVDAYRSVLRSNEEESQAQKLRAKQAEVDALEAEGRDVEARLEALRTDNALVGSAEDAANAQAEVVQQYADQLTRVRNDRIALENRLATGSEQLAILDPATRTLQEQLWQAEAELARVKLTLKPRHPAVEAAQQEVTVLRKQLESSSKATPEALKRDIDASLGLERQLQQLYDRERARMADLERLRRDEQVLLGERDRVRSMADARRRELLDQRLTTRLAESGDVGVTARIIEAPTPPEAAAWPRPKLVLAAGAVLGLVGGVVCALLSLPRNRDIWMSGPQAVPESPEAAGVS